MDRELDGRRQRERVERTLARLPEAYALVLVWRYREEKSVREMAELTGKTEKAIERLLSRARLKFKESWNDENSDEEREFRRLLVQGMETGEPAPPSLKARLYSALVRAQQETGPLASLEQSVNQGHGVCVFEKLVQIALLGEGAKSRFFCNVCHARILAESFDHPPIYWRHCPYVEFKS